MSIRPVNISFWGRPQLSLFLDMETLKRVKSPKIARTTEGDDASEEGDRITNLPDPIIHYIYSFLETIDIIRASAVCRSWKYLWLSRPYFSFDIQTVWSNPWKFNILSTRIERFKDFVNWVLVMSKDSSIDMERFRLWIVTIRDDDNSVQRWMNVAARRNVKELYLVIDSQTPTKLPISLVNCESLVVLKLNLFERALDLSNFVGFRRLKSLELVNVKLAEEIVTRKFISACPLLEDLSLIGCVFSYFKVLEICSKSLKHLTIDNSGFADPCRDGLNKSELKIACSSLVSLDYQGYALDFSLQDLISLEDAFIYMDPDVMEHVTEEESGYVICKILRGLCNVEVLKLSASLLACLAHAPSEYFCTSFRNLKSLKFSMCHPCHAKPIINLLKCSLNLEVLCIHFDETDLTDWEVPDMAITCLTCHLKMVELVGAVGNDNELNLIKFLLKNGHVSEKMSILLWKDVLDTEQIIQEIMEFPTSSSTVALTFLHLQSEVSIFDL